MNHDKSERLFIFNHVKANLDATLKKIHLGRLTNAEIAANREGKF